jgi:hypothetical protein
MGGLDIAIASVAAQALHRSADPGCGRLQALSGSLFGMRARPSGQVAPLLNCSQQRPWGAVETIELCIREDQRSFSKLCLVVTLA